MTGLTLKSDGSVPIRVIGALTTGNPTPGDVLTALDANGNFAWQAAGSGTGITTKVDGTTVGSAGSQNTIDLISGTGISVGASNSPAGETNYTINLESTVSGASFVTLGGNATLTGERTLTAGNRISLTDNGANSTVVVANAMVSGSVTFGASTSGSSVAASTGNSYSFTVSHALGTTPDGMVMTPQSDSGFTGNGDNFAIKIVSFTSTQVTVHVYRVDNAGGTWGQSLRAHYVAW